MKKENLLYGIIGVLVGLIIGFTGTNYINRSSLAQQNAPTANPAQPQISNQVVRDQPQTGGMMPQVQQTLDRAEREPNNFDAQLAAGDMYYRIQRFEEAAAFFEKALQIKPENYDVLVKAGNARFDAGAFTMERSGNGTEFFQQAEKHYAAALAKNPVDVNVRTDLGLTFFYRQPKDIDRAIKEYRTSLETNPNHEMTLQSLARALKEKGDAADLQETLAKLEQVNPNNPALKQLRN